MEIICFFTGFVLCGKGRFIMGMVEGFFGMLFTIYFITVVCLFSEFKGFHKLSGKITGPEIRILK